MADVDQVAQLQARLEELEAAKLARDRASQEATKVAQLQRAVADEEAIASAEEKLGSGKYVVVRTELGAVILKRPEGMRLRALEKAIAKDFDPDKAEAFALSCVWYPPRAEYSAMVTELPGIATAIANVAYDFAKGRVFEVEKK